MELNAKEQRDGMLWLLGAGTFAVLLTLFLVYSDSALRHSNREQKLGDTLRELRTAQTSLPSGVDDSRQTLEVGRSAGEAVQPAEELHH